MKNAIFTICAKNYLAQAKTLGESVLTHCPKADFYILLSDEIKDEDIKCSKFNVVEAKNIGIKKFYEMAYKYDVIEFSTSIKPFFLEKLINEKKYDKVLYLDPDMVVYNSIELLFSYLDTHDALLTPHLLKPYVDYQGATSEEEILFVGIYNLGFFGINNSENSMQMIKWWKEKLKNQCYADKEDALHVDQKWMDFLPALYGDRVKIIREAGINLAFWNMHERVFVDTDSTFLVDDQELMIFHFSGFDSHDYENIARKQNKFSLKSSPQYRRLFENYVRKLELNDLDYHKKQQYTYNVYDNGVHILKYQRRLFRTLLVKNYTVENPFETNKENSYYRKLETNSLMILDKEGKYYALKKTYGNVDAKLSKLFWVLRIFNKLVGIKRYYLFMRVMSVYNRFENQNFLFKK